MSASQIKSITEHEKVLLLPSHHLTSQPLVEILLEHQERYLLRIFFWSRNNVIMIKYQNEIIQSQ